MGTNIVWHGVYEYGDIAKAFADAAHVIHIDHLHMHRFSSTPLENNAVIAQWDDNDERLYFWSNNSFPTIGIQLLAPALHLRMDQVRVQTHDIGGSFGIKITNYPQMAVCALASRKANGAPIKWSETRSEHMTSSAHGNERTFRDTRVALDKDGVILAVDSRHIDDCGAYPRYEPLGCVIWSQVTPATYRLKQPAYRLHAGGHQQMSGRPQPRLFAHAALVVSGARARHQRPRTKRIPPTRCGCGTTFVPKNFPTPRLTVASTTRENYPRMLQVAKELIGWEKWQAERTKAQAEDRWFGIGIGTTLDSGTNNFGQAQIVNPQAPFSGNSQAANAKLDIYGEVIVAVGSVPQGQGHETTVSQVVADILNIPPDMVNVRVGFDTERNVHTGHSGTYASQFAVSGLSAVNGAAQLLKAEIKKLAAFALQASEDDLEFGIGKQGPEVRVRGTEKAIPYIGLANLANVNTAVVPEELRSITLNCRYTWRAPFQVPDVVRKYGNLTLTYSSQLHIAVIEIDKETYIPKILDYAAVDDCGTVINPMIVEGQVHGATAHGIGAALMENCAYDENGNMLASTFSDYTPITAVNMPNLKYGNIETPSPHSYSGAKGMGEGGGAPLHAISAALQDALFREGIIIDESHNNASTLFELIQKRRRSELRPNVAVERGGI
jgi:CO/xanthine dehydrogenase Mo-binding subunit